MLGEVGTKKIFENESIIVWEFILEPGESTPIHEHKFDYLFYPINGAPLQVFSESGDSLGTFDATEGNTFAFKVEDGNLISVDGKGIKVPAKHYAKNVGSKTYREILIEAKSHANTQ